MKTEIIDIDLIKPDSKQVRQIEPELEDLERSISKFDVMKPIEIDENNFIITGEMRWRAAKKVGKKTIECKRIIDLTDTQKIERQLHENIQYPISELEKGIAIKRYKQITNLSMREIAKRMMIPRTNLRRWYALANAPK